MMLTVPAGILEGAGVSEAEARVVLACALFDSGRLDLWPAAQLAGMSRVQFEAELNRRRIPIFRPTEEEVLKDIATARRLGI